jgi:hypothetical protein
MNPILRKAVFRLILLSMAMLLESGMFSNRTCAAESDDAMLLTADSLRDYVEQFQAKAEEIKTQVQTKLWDKDAMFFKVLPQGKNKNLPENG